MAIRLDRLLLDALPQLRMRPTPFRIRGLAGPETVVDSRSALLVWRPRWVTPVYAVPRDDVRVRIIDVGPPRALDEHERRRPVLDPSVSFDAHTAPGTVVELLARSGPVRGFVPEDPDIAGHVLVDFAGLSWWEEDDEVVAHPRDPFQRIDVRPSRAHLELRHHGTVLAATDRAVALWEHLLPVRWYLPREDVVVPLEPSGTTTWCAYKGRATYWTALVGDRRLEDVGWSYERPLSDGIAVQGRIAFFTERIDALLDGAPLERPTFPGA